MKVKPTVKAKLVANAKLSINRAHNLYQRICINGATRSGKQHSPLMNPDRRDAATFIFFEVAAQYESFCCEAFKIEVRKKFGVAPQKAVYLMGSSDKGLSGVMGWAVPHLIQNRAQHLYGQTGFFGRFESIVTKPIYDQLSHAHKVRNRIAHNGHKAVTDYNKIIPNLGVPIGSRKGLSVGRLLMDYPHQSQIGSRWFDLFLANYEKVINEFDNHVIV